MEVIPYGDSEGHKYTVIAEPDSNLFTGQEEKLVDAVCEKLTPLNSKELSDKTHKEVEGWKETVSGQLISYNYAERIKEL